MRKSYAYLRINTQTQPIVHGANTKFTKANDLLKYHLRSLRENLP